MNEQLITLAGGAQVVVDWDKKGKCSQCSADIYWSVTRNQKNMPINLRTKTAFEPDAWESHFASCPEAKKFRRT